MSKKIAIVTGGSRGLGKAMVTELLDKGYDVISLARKKAELSNPALKQVHADLSKNFDWSTIHVDFSQYDEALLINNAGMIGPVKPIWKQSFDEIAALNHLNITELMKACSWFIANVKEKGTIVNISSGAAQSPIPAWSTYCASKAAVDMFSETIQKEVLEAGMDIRIFSVAPGVIDSDMQAEIRTASNSDFSSVDRFKEMKEAGELRSPEHVATMILSNLNQDNVVWSVRDLSDY